jgi:hypothetical protein
MIGRGLIIPIVLAGALCLTVADARAFDDGLYPSWSGGWTRVRDGKHGNWDPEKPRGLGQEAPLTAAARHAAHHERGPSALFRRDRGGDLHHA